MSLWSRLWDWPTDPCGLPVSAGLARLFAALALTVIIPLAPTFGIALAPAFGIFRVFIGRLLRRLVPSLRVRLALLP